MTKHILTIILLAAIGCFSTSAGKLFGRINGSDGNPVPYAAIYFEELKQGVSADEDGNFQLELPPARYHCRISSIGYKSIETPVNIGTSDTRYNFTLQLRTITLAEVQVTANGNEDPAYAIMRQVIAHAPYYECSPDTFAAHVYVKGTGKIIDTPRILDLSANFRKDKEKMVNRLFVLEKVSKVTFGAPNQWDEQVEAESNTFPQEMTVDLPVSITNFYSSDLYGSPSPLRKGAFTYYKYKLEDRYEEGGQIIDKISVTPRREENGLFSGWLYVIEDTYCLGAADLQVRHGNMLDARIVATFQQVKPGTWLIGSQVMKCSVNALGIKLGASYTLSAQYSHIGNATSTRGDVVPLTKRAIHIADEIDKIQGKEGLLDKSDAYKLSSLAARLMEENMIAQGRIKRKSKYDLTYQLGQHRSNTDSMAQHRDSAYWDAMRSVPLDQEERESYLRHRADTISNSTPDNSNDIFDALMSGRTFYTGNKNGWLHFGGIWSLLTGYNFVDGYKVGASISLGYKFSDATALTIKPSAYYNTARHAATASIKATLDYMPMRRARLSFSGGRVTADYNTENPASAGIVAISTALFGRNDVKYYDRAYASISNDIEIANGTRFSIGASWERRRPLDNHIDHSWFKKDASPNVPANDSYIPLPAKSEALTASAAITFTPTAYYYIINHKKRYLASRFPTMRLAYTRGIGFKDNAPSYNRIDLSIEHEVELGVFNKIIYQVRGGLFFDASGLQFPDFKHFAATRFPLTTHRFSHSFVLLDNYRYSTDSRYAEAGITWQAPRMVLKFIPILHDKNFTECLHLRSAVTRHRSPYSELGYSINILDIASIGIFTSWYDISYNSTGISISLPLNMLF